MISGCIKDENNSPPTLAFLTEPGYTASDTMVKTGAILKLGIHTTASAESITNFIITLQTKNGLETALDSGLYKENFNYTRSISFGASDWEKWTFTVMDKNRNKTSICIKLTKDPASDFGPIISYSSIILGTQHNTTFGQFLVTSTGSVITETVAASIQNLVNIITYYGELQIPETYYTLSSPNETDAPNYYPSLTSWTEPKNEMRYKADSLSVTETMFNAATNDSLIISNYTSATIGKRKFKNARTGYVIPFQIAVGPEAGKRGLIHVKNCSGLPDGTIEIAIKMQQ